MPFTDTFDQFTDELASRLSAAQRAGMGRQEIVNRAEDVGDWLSRSIPPKSPEQRLLKEMWEVSNNQEQQMIASTLVKLVERKAPNATNARH